MDLREQNVREKLQAVTDRIWPAVLESLESLRNHFDQDVQPDKTKQVGAEDETNRGM